MEQKKALILIVDDQPNNVNIILNFLEEQKQNHYRFIQAVDGKVACRLAENKIPDLILLDWEMPEMNGIETLKWLKDNPKTCDIPVIMVTGRTASEDLDEALEQGAADYIKKPIDKYELLARVRSSLQISFYIDAVQKQNERLEDVNREKDGMVSIVAHDLRSPLNKIKGLMQLMPMVGDLNDEQKELKEKIDTVISQGIEFIQDLMYINSVESEEGENIEFKDFVLNDFVNDFLSAYEEPMQTKSQKLEKSIPETELQIHTDANLLTRILDNLLSNAIKFSEKGKTISFEVKEKDSRFQFSIKDEGPGIDKKDQEKMFKKFQRLSARPTGGESSTGLGLSIVKTLVEKLDGEIKIESELKVGTTFHITI